MRPRHSQNMSLHDSFRISGPTLAGVGGHRDACYNLQPPPPYCYFKLVATRGRSGWLRVRWRNLPYATVRSA
jgi:hypothetical protein